MKVKWCISDIDGTLINTKRELDDRVINAIHQYEKLGGTFILATGRTMLTARDVVNHINPNTPVICGNGSLIQYTNGKTLLLHKISKEASLPVAQYAIDEGFDFIAFSSDTLWYPSNSIRVGYFKKRNDENDKQKINLVEFSKANALPHGEIVKFFIWNMDEKKVLDFGLNCNGKGDMNFVQSVKGTLDIDPIQATKGNGLKYLANYLNIQLENTAAFGDNKNDLDMLQSVGFPVAVSNAEDELKKVAWRICPSNDECGVAIMLEEFMSE